MNVHDALCLIFWLIVPTLKDTSEIDQAWISNYMLSIVLGEIIYPFPNFNSCTVEV